MTKKAIAALALAAALAGCRAKTFAPPAAPEAAFSPPQGKRAFSLSIDKSQTEFLSPGDAAEIIVLIELLRPDGAGETRSETLSARGAAKS